MKKVKLSLGFKDWDSRRSHTVEVEAPGEITDTVTLDLDRRQVASLAHKLITMLEGPPSS